MSANTLWLVLSFCHTLKDKQCGTGQHSGTGRTGQLKSSHLIIPPCASATKSPAEKCWTSTVKKCEKIYLFRKNRKKWWQMMTGLFRSLTLRSARHSLARKGRLKCGRQETHSYLVVCLHSSSFWLRVFVLFSIFEEIFTSKDLEDGRKSCQVPRQTHRSKKGQPGEIRSKSSGNHQISSEILWISIWDNF